VGICARLCCVLLSFVVVLLCFVAFGLNPCVCVVAAVCVLVRLWYVGSVERVLVVRVLC